MTEQMMATAMENLARRAPDLHAHVAGRRMVPDAHAETVGMCKGGDDVLYNPDFVERLGQAGADYMVAFVAQMLATGAMDNIPAGNIEQRMWKTATNLVVNTTLRTRGYDNPVPSAIVDDAIGILGVELAYEQLMEDHRGGDGEMGEMMSDIMNSAVARDMEGAARRQDA
ncbi:MAG: hypothetical protein K2Y02_01945 [Burkholderiaceae bacterium]|nr:hypothetical protein [Burkholderiaceae bacterium]